MENYILWQFFVHFILFKIVNSWWCLQGNQTLSVKPTDQGHKVTSSNIREVYQWFIHHICRQCRGIRNLEKLTVIDIYITNMKVQWIGSLLTVFVTINTIHGQNKTLMNMLTLKCFGYLERVNVISHIHHDHFRIG